MFISYAQNFEDVVLWRALQNVQNGFYIDVGAHDPVVDSISRAFHAQGWRGVHIEPSKNYADALRKAYPNDVVIEALLGARPGRGQFFEIADTGLSTADTDLASRHSVLGREVVPKTKMVIRLAKVLDAYKDRDIHWLKIDVEGHEASVIESWEPSLVRPWIVVVECVDAITREDTSHLWEAQLCALGYDLIYRDGLNRFYLSHHKMELKGAFAFGPNVFDGFSLSGTASSPFCEVQRGKLVAQSAREAELGSQIATLEADQQRAAGEMARLASQYAAREAELGSQIATLEADQQRAAGEMARLASQYAAREAELGSQIATLEADQQRAAGEMARLASQHAAREAELGSQIATLEADQQRAAGEMARLASQHAAREAELGSQIATLEADQQRAAGEMARLASQYAAREAELGSQLAANLLEITRLHDVIFGQSKWGEAAVRHVNQLVQEISSLRNSTCWRLTRPLRGTGNLVKDGIWLVRRIPGVMVRRTARICRSRAPRLYFQLATTRSVRRLYEPFAGRVSAAPHLTPVATPRLVAEVVGAKQLVQADANVEVLQVKDLTLPAEQALSMNLIEDHSSSVEFALLAALSKAPQGRRIYA